MSKTKCRMVCLCYRNFAKQKRDHYVKKRICPYVILSKLKIMFSCPHVKKNIKPCKNNQ